MTTEFQVLYEPGQGHYEAGRGAVMTLLAIAEGEDQLRHQMSQAGYHVIGVNPVRAVVDWDQPHFDRDEAAAYLRMKSTTLSMHKGGGTLPWSKVGVAIYPRKWLEQYILDNANEAGKAIADRLTKEAA